jgi:parallel beta-helix repeat protein
MKISVIVVAALLCAVTMDPRAESPVNIGSRSYEQNDGKAYLLDERGMKWEIQPGEVAVKFRSYVSESAKTMLLSTFGLTARRPAPNVMGFVRVRFDAELNVLDLLRELVQQPEIEDAYPNTLLQFQGEPNDEYFDEQWNITKMRVDKAWDVTTGSSSVTIAILDNGIDTGHEDFVDVIWSNPGEIPGDGIDNDADSLWYGAPLVDDVKGWDFKDGDNDPRPALSTDAHGTPVAGLASATRNNSLGVAGIAGGDTGDRPRLVAIRCNCSFDVVGAIRYCWKKDIDVINMSWTTNDPDGAVAAELDSAYAHGTVLVAAAGTTYLAWPLNKVFFPANYEPVIAVAATDPDDGHLTYSAVGLELDVAAPSGRRLETPTIPLWTVDNYQTPGDNNPTSCQCPPDNVRYYSGFSGTSASSPEVVGVVALLRSHFPNISPAQVTERLRVSAVDLGQAGLDSLYGYGRVDAYRALTEWGTIDENVTWSPSDTRDGVRYVSGDLTIAAGATLTIMPGTTVRVASNDDLMSGVDTTRIEFNVEGELVADGTDASPIVFESWNPQTTEDWVGFYFDNQSAGGTFDHCVIKRAEYAIESYVPLTVTNTAIDTCRYAGVVSQAGGALVQGCALTDPGSYGVFLTTDTTLVRGTVISNAVSTALHVQPNASVSVRTSQFLNSDTGLYHSGDTQFANVDSNCVFSGNTIGVHCYDTGTLSSIMRSSIHDNNHGIACDEFSHPLIRYCTVEENGMGILCTNCSEPSIRNNRIRSNDSGIVAATGGNPDIGTYSTTGLNTITANVDYHVVNWNEVGIVAQNNSWGKTSAPCGPKETKLYGAVDVSYPLCYDPNTTSLIEREAEIPRAVTGISAIVPNPFNPTTTVHYSLAAPGAVQIRVYDVAGRFVRELVNRTEPAGDHVVPWNGIDRTGNPVASGIYFVKMDAGRESFTRKMVLLK